jgi:hypothetical protein
MLSTTAAQQTRRGLASIDGQVHVVDMLDMLIKT